jgi:hypothetical protein
VNFKEFGLDVLFNKFVWQVEFREKNTKGPTLASSFCIAFISGNWLQTVEVGTLLQAAKHGLCDS